jgi:hypothetical protein
MKWLLTSVMLLSFSAFAENFTRDVIIDIDGVRHQCTPIGNNPLSCIQTAYSGPFSRDEATRLCAGAYDDSPALCGMEAYRGIFSKEEAIQLCLKATSTGPGMCAQLAYNGPFSKTQAIDLCRNNGSERRAVCALDAYRGVYSKEEAIAMCKEVRFNEKGLVKDFNKDELTQLIQEANIKAFEKKEYK